MTRRLRDDRGAGTVVVVGMLASAVLVVTSAHALAATLVAHARAASAADAAALAAADTASGREPGTPCDNAARIAALHGAALTACLLDGLVATVAAEVPAPLVVVSARATAGPP